jgi:hypothetical protein
LGHGGLRLLTGYSQTYACGVIYDRVDRLEVLELEKVGVRKL